MCKDFKLWIRLQQNILFPTPLNCWLINVNQLIDAEWGIYASVTIIAPDNGLSPDWHQGIIWINAGVLLIGPLETNFSEVLIEMQTFSFKKMHFKVSSAK